MDEIILAAEAWAKKERYKLVSPSVFINFLQSKESPLPAAVVLNFFSRPVSIYDRPWGFDAPPTVTPETLWPWNNTNSTWTAVQSCCSAWSESMSWQLRNDQGKISYEYNNMQELASDILHAVGKLSCKYKKQLILNWDICTCCWRVAIQGKRCPVHEFSDSKEVKRSNRIKKYATENGVIISNLLNSIYKKINNNIQKSLENLPLTKQYLLNLNIDLSNNRLVIDALDECGNEQQRLDLHEAMSKDPIKARGLLAKCEFWLELESKRPGWGGRRKGAGRKAPK